MTNLSEEHLVELLTRIGPDLVLPDSGPPSFLVSPARSRTRRRITAIVATIALIGSGAIAIPPVRAAIKSWFGIGSTRIEISPTPPSVTANAGISSDLPRITQKAAASLLGQLGTELPELDDPSLGTPIFAEMPEGGVVAVWNDGSTLWVHGATIQPSMLFKKLASDNNVIRPLGDLGDDGVIIEGDHFLQTPHRVVAASTTVLWIRGTTEFRFEADGRIGDIEARARELDAKFASP